MDNNEPIPGKVPTETSITEFVANTPSPVPPKTETILNIEQAKRELLDPRTISKNNDAEGRSETTQAIIEVRSDTRKTRDDITEKELKLEEIANLTSNTYQQESEKFKELAERLETLVVKLKSVVGIGDKQTSAMQREIDAIKSERNALYSLSHAIEDELKTLREKQVDIPSPKQLLDAYYEKTLTQPLTNEQKKELLKPAVLASLSTEEYIALWKRLNPYFLSHVTRQGLRDHNAMPYHSAGLGEFHAGFLNILLDEKNLRPPIAITDGLRGIDQGSIQHFLESWVLQAKTEDEAKKRLLSQLHFTIASAPNFPDKTAVHFAAQIVADDYYGGETRNEVFFIYPTDILGSQNAFAFNGGQKDFTRRQNETKWNDVFIWTDPNNPVIPVDSSMVFLPNNTPVDPVTGSKYSTEIVINESKELRVPIENTSLVIAFIEKYKKLDDQSSLKKAIKEYDVEKYYDKKQELLKNCLNLLSNELQEIGIATDSTFSLATELFSTLYFSETLEESRLKGILVQFGAHLKRAENPIPAKQYWESFFAKNPTLRPKHIYYYDGNPTEAVIKFLQQNNIGRADTEKTEGQLLGFDNNHVIDMKNDPRSNAGYDELMVTANKIIENHYTTK